MKSEFAAVAVTSHEGPVRQARTGPVTASSFHKVRNVIVRAAARYGSVGPRGEVDLATAESPDPKGGPVIAAPDFYVVEDWYGDGQRVYVEPKASSVSPEWLLDMARTLHGQAPDWDVLASFGEGVVAAISESAIEFGGWRSGSADLATIVDEIRRHLSQRQAEQDAKRSQRLTIVRQLIPNAWAASEARALVLIGHFKTTADGSPGDSVWLLHREDKSLLALDEYRLEPDAVRPLVYWARRSGELSEYRSGPSDGSDALIAEWALRTKGKPTIGTTKLDVRKGARHWTFDLLVH